MRSKHRELFSKFSATFKPETLTKWEAMVQTWEANPQSKPNPFEEPINGMYLFSFVTTNYLCLL